MRFRDITALFYRTLHTALLQRRLTFLQVFDGVFVQLVKKREKMFQTETVLIKSVIYDNIHSKCICDDFESQHHLGTNYKVMRC